MKYIVLEHQPNDCRLKIKKDGICQTLTCRMGTGGGNVPIILALTESQGERKADYLLYQDTIGAICARDYKGVGNQYVGEDKLIVYESDNDNNEQLSGSDRG